MIIAFIFIMLIVDNKCDNSYSCENNIEFYFYLVR